MLKDAPHYLTHRLSAQTNQGSPSQPAPTARPPAPSLSHPLDPAWRRRDRRRLFSCSQHGSSGCRPIRSRSRFVPLLPQSPAANAGAPRVPPPPRIPRNRAASPPARRPPHPQRRDGARSTTSGTPAGPSAPRAPVPDPPESGRASAAPTRCPRPRSPTSPPRRAAPLPPRGGRWHVPCAGRGGRARAGGRGRPTARPGAGSSGAGEPEPPPLVRQGWPEECWVKVLEKTVGLKQLAERSSRVNRKKKS